MNPAVTTLEAIPSFGLATVSSLKPSRDKKARVPAGQVQVRGVQQDIKRLADYSRVCGFTLRDSVPATWIHVLAFPLHVHILGSSDATVRLMGAVHVSNSMTMHRGVSVTDPLDLTVGAENVRPHKRGALVDMVARAEVDGETVWSGVSTYLAAGMTAPGEPDETRHSPFEPVRPGARWRVPKNLGREYRRVSGDPNPIHTSRLAAKAFGFPRPIIHGMWTHARALAALEGKLPHTYTAHVDFVKPVFLPSTIGFTSQSDGGTISAEVTNKAGTKPHLRMRVETT